MTLLRISQKDSFDGIEDVKLRTLNAVMDEEGIIRMKSKIVQRDDGYPFRYPIVLLGENHVTRLLIEQSHVSLKHSNVSTMLSHLREEYWIIHGRRVARSVVRKCVICTRQRAKPLEVAPAPLPRDRVRDARIFEVTGVDFAGPVYLKGDLKAWICIFTCAIYRAVHFELVTSLSTERFMESFRRFIARRGRPSTVYSDNGTNFEGFSNLLKRIDWVKINELSRVQKIQWKFNPPSAPWWERLIQILKRTLRKILGRACLEYEEMLTVLCDCESIINARPLTYLSEDPRDPSPITPNMFLQEIQEVGVPDCDVIDREKFKGRFRYRQRLKDELKQRFRTEYLGELKYNCLRPNVSASCGGIIAPGKRKARHFSLCLFSCHISSRSSLPEALANNNARKKTPEARQISIGDIVMIGNDCTKRFAWPLGRVLEVFPGKDGIVRVARLVTAAGQLIRPVQRLYPLEVDLDVIPEQLRTFYKEKVVKTRGSKEETKKLSDTKAIETALCVTSERRKTMALRSSSSALLSASSSMWASSERAEHNDPCIVSRAE
ncbi:PREDICTED: uncharacterized protein LOC105556221 [Vollenhovia emeryi]|uniref:uncharacterized protein LOC105556221 n=1 Tax=Vollenhovia emeryi TaxID=411798 RepID=UPI0005F4395C|nr:PREDICTED: uncharacterized protein LOC105556221 [Vollenhovia emeryi]